MPPGLKSRQTGSVNHHELHVDIDVFAVIFRATVAQFDDEYFRTAESLKKLAFEKYDCLDFVSVTEGDEEIAISYWETRRHIHEWKNDPAHRLAQASGRDKWYKSFSVEVCEIIKSR
jgi:heme-degrading monooxygenase HmoA